MIGQNNLNERTEPRVPRNTILYAPILAAVLLMQAGTGHTQQPTWEVFLTGVYAEALQDGISADTLDAVLTDIEPIPRVIELDRYQPEVTLTFSEYMETRIPDTLVEAARERYRRYGALLDSIASHYGLDPEFIVALWGLETRFGSYTGSFSVVAAVATLAWDLRRSAFFRRELMHALHILDEQHIAFADMKGSWAGAMGQSQFMPSSFRDFAQDWDFDGRKDIWTNKGDVFASAANYLSRAGWTRGMPWGGEVIVPAGLDLSGTGYGNVRPLSAWYELGVTWTGSVPSVALDTETSLILPDGADGPAYLVFPNYHVLLDWNRSNYFALSVVSLADKIADR